MMSDFMTRLMRAAYHAEAASKDDVTVRLSVTQQGILVQARMPVRGKPDSICNILTGFHEIDCATINVLTGTIDKAVNKVRQ